MKNRYIIISAVVIALLGTFIVYKVTIGKQAEQVDEQVDVHVASNISIDTNESLEESTPDPTPAPTPDPTPDTLPESSIDFKDIDPEIHATYNESTGEIIVDETMARTMLMDSPLFEKRAITDKYVKCILEVYLDGYYTERFDGDAWYRFAATGDTTYLNFELSDEELASKIEQKHQDLLKAEAEQVAAAEQLAAEQNKQDEEDNQERLYKTLAETMGLTVEEVKALMAANEASNGSTTSSSKDQSLASNNTTSESNTPSNSSGSDARPGETTRIPMDGGDGGEYTSNPNDIHFNPSGSGSSSIIDFESAIEANNAAAGDGGEIVVHHYSEECGYSIGDTVNLGEFVITYKGDDVWVDESSGKEYYATKESDNYLSWWSWN